jgi:iron only hydrogenase large subunit-like protein
VLSSLSARYTHSADLVTPLTDRQLLARISHFLRTSFDFDVVHDTTFARHLSLRAHQREFSERRKARQQLPMLASACPGWVCYAEKTHGELLPLLSRTRSPQQMAGLLAKRTLKEWHGRAAVYHVAVMPCYDKKLEASRPDFAQGAEEEKQRDVDCVITTGELDTLMREEGFELLDPVPGEEDEQEAVQQRIPDLVPAAGSSSGGFLFSLLADAWRTHLASLPDSAPQPLLDVRTIRSADYTEYVLRAADSDEVLFRGAACYGFRNLQNLVRRLQRSTGLKGKNSAVAGRLVEDSDSPRRGRGGMVRRGRGAAVSAVARNGVDEAYDYVEVMACPGGCVNGGGQLRPPTNALEGQEQPDPSANSLVARALAAADSTEMQIDAQGSSSGVATPLSTGGEEEVRGWKGTSREWVRKVEARYFADTPAGSVHAAQALGVGGTPVEAQRAVQTALAREVEDGVKRQKLLDAITRAVEAQLCGTMGDEALRTQYHAVSDEAISGLAVQW